MAVVNTMKVVHCSRCRSFIQPDELRYIVAVHVTLDTDGFADKQLDAGQLAAEMASNEEGLLDLFTREMAFTVCRNCRDSFVSNPLNCRDAKSRQDLGLLQ